MLSSNKGMLGNRKGTSFYEVLIWFFRLILIGIIIAFTYYLWSSTWSVSYDTASARGYAFQSRLEYSGIFNPGYAVCSSASNDCIVKEADSRPYIVYLSMFKDENVQNFAYYKAQNQQANAVVKYYNAPVSANITLEWRGGGKPKNESIYLNKEDYEFNNNDRLNGGTHISYVQARWPVIIIDDTNPGGKTYNGTIYSQVITR